MNPDDIPAAVVAAAPAHQTTVPAGDMLSPLLRGPVRPSQGALAVQGAVIGELLALSVEGALPLVRFPGQSAAVVARSSVDLHAAHVGRSVVLLFEGGDPASPVVIGVVRSEGWPLAEQAAQVEVDADGRRMVISARDQLVLRCGQASITLTKAGKVLIEGSYLSSRSTGVNRIKGGSVQLN